MITITISTSHGLATVEDGVASTTLRRQRGRVAVCFCGWKGVYRFHEEELEMDIEAHRNEQRQKVKDVLKHLPLAHVGWRGETDRDVVHCAWWF